MTQEELEAGAGMPLGVVNAYLPEEQVMRVGVPHRGGRLAFHAFNQDYPVMVSANAFWDTKTLSFKKPTYTDLDECDVALDSAGFTAMHLWKSKGKQRGMAGVFPWTYEEYLEFATSFGAAWYSQPDLCCEPEIAKDAEAIDYRIRVTATLLEGCLHVLHRWHQMLADQGASPSVIASMVPPPVPVLQGWSVSDYLKSLDLMQEVWARWTPWLAPPALIGLGSVCRRTLVDHQHGLYALLAALEGRLPKGAKLHLFGVKGAALAEVKMLPWVASADSMAYDFGARVEARKTGMSNTLAHRARKMSSWMSAAAQRMAPAAGDQFRLAF